MISIPKYSIATLKSQNSRTVLIIPVINEGVRIRRQVKKIFDSNNLIDLIIADGGSDDGSLDDLDYLKGCGVTAILTKTDSGGLSAQLRMAFSYALNAGYEFFITMDGNDKDGPEGIERIQAKLLQGYDFVQGSRYVTGGLAVNTPWKRYLAIRLVHSPLISLGAGLHFSDTTNGFRGFSKRILMDERISIFRDIFDTYELLAYLPVAAGKFQFKCCEVPVTRAYPKNENTPTKILGFKAQLHLLCILLRAVIGSFYPKRK
jgi:dolichol-phosphate mannosyltransferase